MLEPQDPLLPFDSGLEPIRLRRGIHRIPLSTLILARGDTKRLGTEQVLYTRHTSLRPLLR
jgi:hypothetical protein